MTSLFPASNESPLQRHVVVVAILLLHAVLVWILLQAAGNDIAGTRDWHGDGDALVVDFVALPAPQNNSRSKIPMEAVATPFEEQTPVANPVLC